LGLLYAEPPGGRLQDQPFLLEAELSEALARPVQCVVMNRAPADLVHRVLRDQRLLLDLEPSLRVRFEVAARNRYFDLKPFLAVSEPGERRVTDPDLLEKKLAFIETCVSELQRLAIADKIDTDLKERRFIEHTLQLAIQACLDAASHVVSDDRLGEPNTNQELFRLLARAGRLSQELARSLSAAAGFRNVLVRGYAEVDSRVTRDVP